VDVVPAGKVSPEWDSLHPLLANATAVRRLADGEAVSRLARDHGVRVPRFLGALRVDGAPGGRWGRGWMKRAAACAPCAPGGGRNELSQARGCAARAAHPRPRRPTRAALRPTHLAAGGRARVHIRAWFPHVSDADARRLGLSSARELSPGPELAAAYQRALGSALAAGASTQEQEQQQQQQQQQQEEEGQEDSSSSSSSSRGDSAAGRGGGEAVGSIAAGCEATVASASFALDVSVCAEVRP
jgi:hypothetical protein